ncbi:hypothetical protein D3C72_1306170 [compost metagenome]
MTAGFVTQGRADFLADRFHVDQVQIAVFLAGRANAQQRHLGRQHGGLNISGAAQATMIDAIEQQLLQPRLNNRRLALVDHVDLVLGNVDPQHLMATGGQTARTHSTHITQSENTDVHSSLFRAQPS